MQVVIGSAEHSLSFLLFVCPALSFVAPQVPPGGPGRTQVPPGGTFMSYVAKTRFERNTLQVPPGGLEGRRVPPVGLVSNLTPE